MKSKLKKVTSLSLGFSFIIMSYTGIMLYLVPRGKVAYWSDWHLLGLSKQEYGDIHTSSMILFLVFGALHIYFNWKPIISYMKSGTSKVSFTKQEFLIALSLNLFVVLGTLFYIQPFKAYLDFEDSIKSYWAQKCGEPPYPHAEESSLKVFCKKSGINLELAKLSLNQSSIEYKITDTLKEIGKNNKLSPQKIYEIIAKSSKVELKQHKSPISRLGQKTLQELFEMGVINLKKSLVYIKSKGYTQVSNTDKMKVIADELETTPYNLYEEIKYKDNGDNKYL